VLDNWSQRNRDRYFGGNPRRPHGSTDPANFTSSKRMAQRYLLPCGHCSQKIPVETTQAGQTITCSGCQAEIKLGTLRDIRALAAEDASAETASRDVRSSRMSLTRRALFVGGILLLVTGLLWGVRSASRAADQGSKQVPNTLSDEKVKTLEAVLRTESPSRMLDRWSEVKEEAVAEWVEDPSIRARRMARTFRFYSWVGFGLAGLGLLGVVGTLVLPTAGRGGRQANAGRSR
jgi:hypothetical protein